MDNPLPPSPLLVDCPLKKDFFMRLPLGNVRSFFFISIYLYSDEIPACAVHDRREDRDAAEQLHRVVQDQAAARTTNQEKEWRNRWTES